MRKLLVFDLGGRDDQSVSKRAFNGAEGAARGARRAWAAMFLPGRTS